MNVDPGYREGHLIVAAVRVLEHRDGRPPTIEEIGKSLGTSNEWAGVLVRALEGKGIVRLVRGPFETRVEIKDHLLLESLSREESTARVDEELREFSARKKREEETLRNLFASGDALRKQEERIDKIAEGLKGFKPREPKPNPLFKDPPKKDR